MEGIKQILCGASIILFGILLASMDSIWLPVIGTIKIGIIGALVGLVGVALAIKGCCKNKGN